MAAIISAVTATSHPLARRVRLRAARAQAHALRPIHKRRLRNRGFTVVSNDCWGAEAYRHLELPYRTPFVGLFIFAPDYVRLLEDLPANMRAPLDFTDSSRYAVSARYPIGVIGDDIEIHFVHLQTEDDARSKWTRRAARIDYENLFVKMAADKDECTPELVERFDALPFEHKVCLTRRSYPAASARQVTGWSDNGASLFWLGLRQYDWIGWLNRQSGGQPARR